MNAACLWAARDSVIARIEIREEDALRGLQELMDNSGLACGRHVDDDRPTIREDPDIIMGALAADLRLIGVDAGARPEPLDQEAFGRCLVPGNVLDKIARCPDTGTFTQPIRYDVHDDAVRKTTDEALVNAPYLKSLPT